MACSLQLVQTFALCQSHFTSTMKLAMKAMKAIKAKAMKKGMKAKAMKATAMKKPAMKAMAMEKAMKAKTAAPAPAMKAMTEAQVDDAICIEELETVLQILPAVLVQWCRHAAGSGLDRAAGHIQALQWLISGRWINPSSGMVFLVWSSEQELPAAAMAGGPLSAFHELEVMAYMQLRRLKRRLQKSVK